MGCLLNAERRQENVVLSLIPTGPHTALLTGVVVRIPGLNGCDNTKRRPGPLSLHSPVCQWGDSASSPAGLPGAQGKGWDRAEGQGWGPGLTLCTTLEVIAMFSASSTVLVATVLTLETTASLTALACSLVFSATVGGI